jgi:hypothetical protein
MNRQQAYTAPAHADLDLGHLVDRFGMPDPFELPDGRRTTGSNFAAMSLHIIGQQISTKVAFVLSTDSGMPSATPRPRKAFSASARTRSRRSVPPDRRPPT